MLHSCQADSSVCCIDHALGIAFRPELGSAEEFQRAQTQICVTAANPEVPNFVSATYDLANMNMVDNCVF